MRSASLTTLEGVQRFTRTSRGLVARDLDNNKKLFLYTSQFGSPLCRSTTPVAAAGRYTFLGPLVLLNCFKLFFIHLKLELLTQFPASNDEKYVYF